MQKLLAKYGTAIHLALLSVTTLFLSPFCSDNQQATVLLWMSLFTFVWVLFSPSRRSGEVLFESRIRVVTSILRDPVFWAFIVVLFLVSVRALNDDIRLIYDAEHTDWKIQEAFLSFYPGCVTGAGYLPFANLVALIVLFVGCRHALGKKARFAYLFALSGFASISAFTFIGAHFYSNASIINLTKCSLLNSSFLGTAFGLCFLGGLVALVGVFECGWNKFLLLVGFSATCPLIGLYFFAPTHIFLSYLALGLILFVIICVYAGFHFSGSVPIKCAVALLVAFIPPILCVLGFAPTELNETRFAFLTDPSMLFEESFFEMRETLMRIASEIWADHPWIGAGINSFPLSIRFKATPGDWTILKVGQAVCSHGWWHLIVERGIIGVLLYAVILCSFFYTFIYKLCKAFRARFNYTPCILAFYVLVILSVQAFYDVSFLRSDVTLITGAYLALACAAIPNKKNVAEKEIL